MDETDDLPNSPKLKEARHAAAAIIKALKITEAPVTLNDVNNHIKKTVNLTVKGTNELSNNIDGVLKCVGDRVFILYNESKSVSRQRFTVAHEMGHLHMGHVHGNSSIDLGSDNFDEIEANHYAAHLLMPPSLLRKDIKAGLKKVDLLAKKYQVSEEAMWWQIDKAGLLKIL